MKGSILQALAADGIQSNSHHMKIKASFKKISGRQPTPEEVNQIRTGLLALEHPETVKVAAKAAGAKPSRKVKASETITPMAKNRKAGNKPVGRGQTLEQLKEKYPDRIVRVAATNDAGIPTRVVIRCMDIQKERKSNGRYDFVHSPGDAAFHREIAVQDLFQVRRCKACQKRYAQIYRNERAKARRKQRKQS